MELKRQKKISRKQLEIIYGSILSDAYVTKKGQIQFEQGASQKAYLFWKYRELSSISYDNPPNDLDLTDLSLAVWYMDDGWTESGKYFISVEGFGHEYRNSILKQLEEKFGILATIKERGHLNIRSQSIPKFVHTVEPYIFESLSYKLPNGSLR